MDVATVFVFAWFSRKKTVFDNVPLLDYKYARVLGKRFLLSLGFF